jgi:tetratricopeptide (TPR) repeat protein
MKFLALAPLFALAAAQTSQDLAERQLLSARSALDEPSLLALRLVFEGCLRRDARSSRCASDLARADADLYQAADFRNDKKAAEHWLDLAIADTRRALALDERQAEAHALLADLYGAKIGSGGMLAAMRYGPRSEAETRRALALDPNNALAYAVLGRRYLYSPRIFGGDLNKAVESFRKSTQLDPQNPDGFVWLAIACRKQGDSAHAQAALAEALRLNRRSAFALRVQAGGD